MDEDMSAEFDLHALDKKEIRQQVFEQLLSQITTASDHMLEGPDGISLKRMS